MALVSGYLKQKCLWNKRPDAEGEYDNFGQPIVPAPAEIKCRWEVKSGFVRGIMGDGTGKGEAMAVQHKVLVDSPVSEGDELIYIDKASNKVLGGIVRSVESIVDIGGREQGRTCYV
ncbi:MAG: hypothetical protein RR214_00510 [Synergistaceae bacterium]